VRCAQKMTRRGGAGKGSGSKGRRGAEHGQACTKERNSAVAVRAALESAMQVGRGDEGNRQAEMANPTKCIRYSICGSANRVVGTCSVRCANRLERRGRSMQISNDFAAINNQHYTVHQHLTAD
jgi:hypothetical protein